MYSAEYLFEYNVEAFILNEITSFNDSLFVKSKEVEPGKTRALGKGMTIDFGKSIIAKL